jgi:octaprenyl-diphosphate synthase
LSQIDSHPQLKTFQQALQAELDQFNREYHDILRSDVFLVDQVVNYLVRNKGKQIRPLLIFLVAKLFGGVTPRCIKAAIVVELLHNATLVHDDIVDDAPFRRGFPTVNHIWRNKISVLVGDYILAKSLTGMLDLRDLVVFELLSETAKRMSRGELLQIAKVRKLDITEDIYLDMISDKTAALISACCELGAITAESMNGSRPLMKEFGEKLGVAFQIRDDVLDFVGVERFIGKQVGRDMREQKITLPLIYAFQHADISESKKILRQIKKGINRKEIYRVVDFVKQHGGIEYSENLAKQYTEEALHLLASLPPSDSRELLANFTKFVIQREN